MNRRIGLSVTLFLLVFTLSACHKSAVQTADSSIQTPAEDASQANEQAASEKPKPPMKEYQETWREEYAVEQAYLAAASVLEDLGLRQSSGQSRTVTTRDPRTGRTITQQVPSGSGGRSDGLSAFLEAGTTAGIQYRINMLLVPPASTEITILASSQTQPESVLRSQSEYLRQKIAQAVLQPEELEDKPVSLEKTVVLSGRVVDVFQKLYEWVRGTGFDIQNPSGDAFYKALNGNTGSNIKFSFVMRQIASDKVSLAIEFSNYEDKPEFETIVTRLDQLLEDMKKASAEETKPD